LLTQDFWKICDFNLYPYGNARRTQNGSSWIFTCQHGVRECEGNVIETCAIKLYDFYTQSLPFVICLEQNNSNWNTSGQQCSTRYGLDWNRIYACSTSSQGNQWENEMAVATEALRPAHTYVPWIVVNGAHTTAAENAIISNMVSYVCTHYTGPEQIAACKRTAMESE
jgi:interferon gamma-inducible protein 30